MVPADVPVCRTKAAVQRHGAYLTVKRWGSQSGSECCIAWVGVYLVPAIALGLIKGVIGAREECFKGVALFGKGETKRGCDAVEYFVGTAYLDAQ